MPKTGEVSKTRNGVRSPMHGFEANPSHRTPSTAGTSEMIPGSAPKAAPVSSPTKPKNPGKSN